MTVSTQANAQQVAGDGVTTVFAFNFVYDSSSVIKVYYVDSTGAKTLLTASQYTLTLNAPVTNQLWGVGGTVTYPLVGSPIAAGTYLYIQRVLPYTQSVSIQNQGNFYPQVTEQALDLLEMQIQQLATGGVPAPSTAPSYVFIGGTVTGSANALVVAQTFPSNFALLEGVLLTITPALPNTGAATLNVAGTGAVGIQRFTPTGAIAVGQGELVPAPTILQYVNGSWFDLTAIYFEGPVTKIGTGVAAGLSTIFGEYYLTGNSTFTIGQSTTLPFFWWMDINAAAGAATITPNASDVINVLGTALAAGSSYVIPQGASARLLTDSNGGLYVNYFGQGGTIRTVKSQVFTNSATYTPSTGMLYCDVYALGGGGGGGGIGSSGTGGAGGGNAGCSSRGIFTAAQIGASQTITIGAAGSAGANTGGNGGTGGTTSLGALMTATGGTGGTGVNSNPSAGGPLAQSAAGTGGDVNGIGGIGAFGFTVSAGNFGGGGASSPWGAGGVPPVGNSAGNNGTGYGSAGSGATATSASNAHAGGAGAPGLVYIIEYCSK